jgi:hypothetical protein
MRGLKKAQNAGKKKHFHAYIKGNYTDKGKGDITTRTFIQS